MPLSFSGLQVILVILILTPFSIIALGLRLWSRHIKNTPLAFDDYMAILALILTFGENICCLIDAFAGVLGVHVSEILATDPSLLQTYLKLTIPGIILWAAANSCVKLSILSLYTILFPIQKFCYVCYGVMAITIAFFLVVFLEAFLLCTPVQYSWDKSIPGGVCNQSAAFLVSGIFNLIVDAFIVILPMPMLFRLQMPLYRRLSVAAMFSLGAAICIISLFRIISLRSWDLRDITFGASWVSIFSSLEPTLGVINACLPTIKPALYRIYSLKGDSKNTKTPGLDGDRQNLMVTGLQSSRFRRLRDEMPLTTI